MVNSDFSVSWDRLHRDSRTLASRLLTLGKFTAMVAISRGGLVPAAIIARELDIRVVDAICMRSYRSDRSLDYRVEILKESTCEDREDLLLIDDLVDTGRTSGVLRKIFSKAHFATVYAKPKGSCLVDTFVTKVSQDTWICFPWDTDLKPVRPIVDLERANEGRTEETR